MDEIIVSSSLNNEKWTGCILRSPCPLCFTSLGQAYLIGCVWNCYRYVSGRGTTEVLVYVTTNDTTVSPQTNLPTLHHKDRLDSTSPDCNVTAVAVWIFKFGMTHMLLVNYC